MYVHGLSRLAVSLSLVAFAIPAAVSQQETPTGNTSAAMTARDYYNELYKAGGLDNFADQYVCFRNDQEPVFFLVADSDALKEFLISTGEFEKLTPGEKATLKKGMAFFVQYHDGLSNGMDYFDREERGEYTEKLALPQEGRPPLRLTRRLRINWETLRYELDVELTGSPQTLNADTGKCEQVSSAIHQHGH